MRTLRFNTDTFEAKNPFKEGDIVILKDPKDHITLNKPYSGVISEIDGSLVTVVDCDGEELKCSMRALEYLI